MIAKISNDFIINTDEIRFILSYKSNSAKEIISNAKKNNNLINATKGKGTRSVIVLKNNEVIASDYNPDTLYNKCSLAVNAIEVNEK